ncbi:hypothetical protein [Methyloversatilis discipulorum]|uniref:hypothetical protein n=1 Tax=Methyloversatilis discipulorum TaxID=1119528 RepID=UPI003F30CBA3
MKLDWSAMLASSDAAPVEAADSGCNRTRSGYRLQEAVTETDSQAIDSKDIEEVCNRVTAVTATFEEPKGNASSSLEKAPGGGGLCALAPANRTATHRPVLDYRLTDHANNGGRIIGAPGDVLADLVRDLRERYGDRLDWIDVREQFEERAAVVEYDGGQPREQAERIAADEVRATMERRHK